jgi:hypothetical protein
MWLHDNIDHFTFFGTTKCTNLRAHTTCSNSLGSMAQPATSSVAPPGAGDLIIKPQTDRYEYRFLKLPNQLRVLLVHDPEADKAACAADVGGLMQGVLTN